MFFPMPPTGVVPVCATCEFSNQAPGGGFEIPVEEGPVQSNPRVCWHRMGNRAGRTGRRSSRQRHENLNKNQPERLSSTLIATCTNWQVNVNPLPTTHASFGNARSFQRSILLRLTRLPTPIAFRKMGMIIHFIA